MAIEDIFHSLEQQADAECREVIDEAKQQAKSIMDDAQAEAEKIKAEKLEHTRTVVEARASQMLNSARLDNKRTVSSARERSIAEVYDKAEAELARLRGNGSYPALFRALAKEALSGVDGDVVMMVDPADKDLAMTVISELGVKATTDTSAGMVGGLTVALDGQRVFRRNTLENRLAKVRSIGQSQVAEILFG
jgi:V/A-type H+-transporting ATPase subunit E